MVSEKIDNEQNKSRIPEEPIHRSKYYLNIIVIRILANVLLKLKENTK